jgi:hypothetical protein
VDYPLIGTEYALLSDFSLDQVNPKVLRHPQGGFLSIWETEHTSLRPDYRIGMIDMEGFINSDVLILSTWLRYDFVPSTANSIVIGSSLVTVFQGFGRETFYGTGQFNDIALVYYPLACIQNPDTVIPGLVFDENESLTTNFHLHPNHPNPFNPATTIRYDLPHAAQVTLVIYDLLGREVTTLVEGYTQPGSHEVVWNAANLPSGIYIARLLVPPTAGVTPEYTNSIKLLLLK